jgi:hypothetical protein
MMSLPSPGSHCTDVLAGAQEDEIVALLAVDEVVVVAATQDIDAIASELEYPDRGRHPP